MFLIKLIHLIDFKPKNLNDSDKKFTDEDLKIKEEISSPQIKNKETINQIKNVVQEKKSKPSSELEAKPKNKILISSFDDLLNVCFLKKEKQLKYELEKNVSLVRFENGIIEISFNNNLDKSFVKDLSAKLLEWTKKRWIITFSKNLGEATIKEKKCTKKKNL